MHRLLAPVAERVEVVGGVVSVVEAEAIALHRPRGKGQQNIASERAGGAGMDHVDVWSGE